MNRKKLQTVGFGPNDVSSDINRVLRQKIVLTTQVNDAWRKKLEEDPDYAKTYTYSDFRKKFLKSKSGKIKKTSAGSRKKIRK